VGTRTHMKNKTLLNNIALVTAVVCGTFSLFVAFQLISNSINTENADPLNMELIEELRQQLRSEPSNDLLKKEIRDLDLLARRTFFSSVSLQNNGALLLLISIIATLIALKILSKLNSAPPSPPKFKEHDSSTEIAQISRNATWSAFGIILALTIVIGLETADQAILTTNQDPKPETRKPHSIPANSWPNLRGPNGLGIASVENAPVDWDGKTGRNILWKTPLPRSGFNSPIVVNNRVFLSCADKEAREVLCFDAETGAILWQKAVGTVPGTPAKLPEVMEDTGFAAATMATDGEHVFAIFATGNVICFDLDGNRKWARNFGPFDNDFGHGASLITYRDMLILQLDDNKNARVIAVNTKSGKTVWETKRDVIVSWSTPILANLPDGIQLVLNGNPLAAGYDPETGKELWRHECMGGEVAPSPGYANGVIFVTTEYQQLYAIKPGSPAKEIWVADGDLPDVSSPLATDDYVFMGSSSAVISCFDAKTGKLLWNHEPDEGFFSSPVLAGKNVYLMDKEGKTYIFEAASEYKPIAAPELGEASTCTPAFLDDRIYIRGNENLYCIGLK
jgi:outer membrane protein assembly factor BamB